MHVDVAIVGGGFAGIATARALAQRRVRAVVLERETRLGVYASGRSAGLGRQLAEDDDTTALTVRGAQLLRELAVAWTPTGGVLGFDDAAVATDYAARAKRFGVPVEALAPAAALARWPRLGALRVAAALWIPSDGTIDVSALLARLADGVDVRTGAGVTAIEPNVVHTMRGDVRARVIVDASGAWAGSLVGAPPLDALKRHVFVLAAEAQASAPWLWHLGADEMYVRADAAGTLACPCDATPSTPGDQEPSPDAAARLAARVPLDAPIVRQWACLRSFTPDRKMRLGRDPDRPWLVWAAGLGGHGATASAAVGERVADAVTAAL